MEVSGSNSLGMRIDIKQLLSEAQHRWLKPAEICEILQNYRKFHISPEAPHKPVSGSVYLFDRKILRYFRKDGHNWRKKRDGKTVKEAHEKLKVGSVEMLHCYYAHGEENEDVQRRSYWLLDQDLMHIVFVHYLEVKGNKKTASFTKKAETVVSCSKNESSLSFSARDKWVSASTYSTSPTSTVTSAYEDVESEENEQASSGFQLEDSWVTGNIDAGLQRPYHLSPYSEGTQTILATEHTELPNQHANGSCLGNIFMHGSQNTLEQKSWEEVLGHSTEGEIVDKQESGNPLAVQANWQHLLGDSSLDLCASINDDLIWDLAYDGGKSFFEQNSLPENSESVEDSFYTRPDAQEEQAVVGSLHKEHSYRELGYIVNQKEDNSIKSIETGNYSHILKQSLVGGSQTEEGLKKADSFSRWIARELGDVDDLALQSTGGISWSVIDGENMVNGACLPNQVELDADTLSPSLSQDQLFSIIDFSPHWAYSNCETEVLITGTLLKSKQGVANCRWSCMFGEVEVPAELLANGILSCTAPPHRAGSVPFYITCSNRLACSEVREFEYRIGPDQDIYRTNAYSASTMEIHLRERLKSLLSLPPVGITFNFENVGARKAAVVNKIISMMEEENCRMGNVKPEWNIMWSNVMDEQFLEKHLKEMLYLWLIHKVTEEGEGSSVLDEEGQGVLHLAAALGYNWVIQPTIVSGVSIDFRDVNGWTAIHWAAFYGREETVAALVSFGAAPGPLTDPSAEFPLGRTPADLASANGHKGISGFLAECSLTTHLSSLNMNEAKEDGALANTAEEGIQTVSERVAISTTEGDAPDVLSLKDSLAAVCNATQAAARIHQIFRIQSFQRKQYVEQGSNGFSSLDKDTLSLLAAKTCRLGKGDSTVHGAAISIQKKYRGWKKRKEFLLIRQRVVKIQAHVRGHQVRKKYKSIAWSVGILEKVILRWKRKGSGFRRFQQDAISKDPITQEMPPEEDNYDLLKEGRKQTEERMQKALTRVKSMAQYPEARAQYRRLLTVAEEFRETKDTFPMLVKGNEDAVHSDEELFDFESLLDDDTFMSIAFE